MAKLLQQFLRSVSLALALALAIGSSRAASFSESFRWNETATDGAGLMQGDATTLLWSIVPDGLAVEGGTSDLVSHLDALHGAGSGGADLTGRPWFGALAEGLDMIGAKTGLEFLYQPDDSAAWDIAPSDGNRGDIRLAGVDLPAGELGNANLPAFGGDIRLDTAGSSFANLNMLRSVFQHEVGHALGLLHVSVPGHSVLMNTGNLPIEGPQFDDLYALTRLYGDRHEIGMGNDTRETAIDLGSFDGAGIVSIGTQAADQQVLAHEIDLVSIDGISDVDYYRFSIAEPGRVTVELTPVGPSYTFTPESGGSQSINAAAESDLTLELLTGDGAQSIAQVNLTGLGEPETLAALELASAGDYVVRVSSEQNRNQFYQLAVSRVPAPGDYNNDGLVDVADYTVWRNTLGSTVFAGAGAGADGNGDGLVEAGDFLVWRDQFGAATGSLGTAVPETASLSMGLIALFWILFFCRLGV